MAKHQHDKNANELWLYFSSVINWVKTIFPKYRKEMKGIEWGILYNRYHKNEYDATELEDQITELMQDEDVTKKSGIYEYLLGGEEKHLSIRKFSDKMKRESYERQKGICPICKNHFDFGDMEGDHVLPWSKGGPTTSDNCQMVGFFDAKNLYSALTFQIIIVVIINENEVEYRWYHAERS